MSKPTKRQLQIIDMVIHELEYIASSNDIHSPSHWTSIEEIGRMLDMDDILTPEQSDGIVKSVGELWNSIASVDECHLRAEAAKKFAQSMAPRTKKKKPKTRIGWLGMLPEPIRSKAIKNALNQGASREKCGGDNIIASSFLWGITPEGNEYWDDIQKQMNAGVSISDVVEP